jgi:hypothetical protein
MILDNLNLVELNALEVAEIDGGMFEPATYIMHQLRDFANGFLSAF